MKPSEYGGSDTDKTRGIQPAPHTLSPAEQLRLIAQGNPADPEAIIPAAGMTIEEALGI